MPSNSKPSSHQTDGFHHESIHEGVTDFTQRTSDWDSIRTLPDAIPQNINSASVQIGANVWVGANSTITKGISIGNQSVIAASNVVTIDIPENCLAGETRQRSSKL